MAGFLNNVITEKGFDCISAAIAGKELKFTCIKMGSGIQPPGSSTDELNDLIKVEATIEITKCEQLNDKTVIVGGAFENTDCEKGFEYRELGLFAIDPNTDQEILFSYGNCGEYCEIIPPSGSATLITKQIDIITYVGAATQVTIQLDNGLYLSIYDFQKWRAEVERVIQRIACDCAVPLKNDEFLTYVTNGDPVRDDSSDSESDPFEWPEGWGVEPEKPTNSKVQTNDYNSLVNKPQINGTTLEGDMSSDQIGVLNKMGIINPDEVDEMWSE